MATFFRPFGAFTGALCSSWTGGARLHGVFFLDLAPIRHARTEETAEPRHLPPSHDEEFVEPSIPEVSVASDLPTHSVVSITSVVFLNLNFFKM